MCEISPSLLANGEVNSFPPGVPVICRLSDRKHFLCRLFAPPGRYLQANSICYMDETVQLSEEDDSGHVGKESIEEEDVPRIKELEVIISGETCCFEKVNVELTVDCSKLDLELLRDRDSLSALARDLIRPLLVCGGCSIKTDDSFNCGIVGIRVSETVGTHRFGYIECETAIVIGKIYFNTVRSKTLGGLSDVRQSLEKALERCSDNVLLVGPPGSGKYSLIAELVCAKNHPVFEVRGLDFIKSHPGETELELRIIFERLEKFNKLFQPTGVTILLVKDVDTLCPKLNNRRGEDVSNISRISSQFTTLLDRYHGVENGILIIGTTSNIESLDAKVRRPGRLGTEIFVRMPSEVQRGEIMAAVLKRTNFALEPSVLEDIIRRTPGYVGADLELLVYTIQRTLRRPSQDAASVVEDCLLKIRPTSLRNSIGLISGLNQTLDSIGGMDELKKTLRVSVLGPLRHPEAFRRFGMSPLKGILLYGPPGCAKTTIAKCLAGESRMTFVSVSAAELYSPYVGDSEKLIARLFNQARLSAPAVIFLDEIDSLVGNRGMQGGARTNDVHIRVLSTLLTEMDGIGTSVQATISSSDDSKNILVIAATNRPDMIDDALLRPGRLTKLIHVPAPEETARFEILKKLSEKVPLAGDVDLRELAKLTERYSGADLGNLCSQAALHAATLDENVTEVNMDHFRHVLKETRPSLTRKQIEWYNEYESKRRTV